MGASLALLLSILFPPSAIHRLILLDGLGPNTSTPGVRLSWRRKEEEEEGGGERKEGFNNAPTSRQCHKRCGWR